MKQVLLNKKIIDTFKLKVKPEFFEANHNSRSSTLVVVCNKKEIFLDSLNLSQDFPISLYLIDTNFNDEVISEDLDTINITNIKVSDVFTDIITYLGHAQEEYEKVEITEIKFTHDGLMMLVGCTLYPKEVTDERKIKTYLLNYFLKDITRNTVNVEDDIFYREPLATLLAESNQEPRKITSISSSGVGYVISIILNGITHILLRLTKVNESDTSNLQLKNVEIDILDNICEQYRYVKELQNTSDVYNTLGKKTVYSSVSNSGERIAIGNRDARNKINNNSLAVTIGNIVFLKYNHSKKVWVIEDTYFEKNLYITNLGEHVSINAAGDKLLTTARYLDDKNNVKNVIYLLARDSKGKWKRFLREILDEEITGLRLSSDGNKASVYTEHNLTDGVSVKGMKFFLRDKLDMVYINVTDDNGNLIYKDDINGKTLSFISNSVTDDNALSNFTLVEDVTSFSDVNVENLSKIYRVVKNTFKIL